MGSTAANYFFLLLLLLQCLVGCSKNVYIVHMKNHVKPSFYATHHDWYSAHLQSLSSSAESDSLLYSYTAEFHGFAATLDPDQAELLRQSDVVVGVYEDTLYQLHTTRTPQFLGLDTPSGLWQGHDALDVNRAAHDVIIGLLDTGVWPESKSFDDSTLPQIPNRWRGKCESGLDFSPSLCNQKLIGARSFSKGYRMASGGGTLLKKPREIESPRDQDGQPLTWKFT